jgi:peptide-methionine (S)-S-oxide reductase
MLRLPNIKSIAGFAALVLGIALVGSASAQAAGFPDPAADAPLATAPGSQTAVFSGGCFWGIQAVFEHVKGVTKATAGYAGGKAEDAHYMVVSSGTTGHAESVQVVFDPSVVSYGQLLKVFFHVAHDPTELNRQGPDEGTQYRSAVWVADDEQQRVATAYIAQLDAAKVFPKKIATQVNPLNAFYAAEGYHQDYLIHHPNQPYIVFNDLPKLADLKRALPELWVEYHPAS